MYNILCMKIISIVYIYCTQINVVFMISKLLLFQNFTAAVPKILTSVSSHNSWLPLKYICFLNLLSGTQHTKGEHVYPEFNTSQEWTGVFPDGTPFTTTLAKKPRFIFVWKTWGKEAYSQFYISLQEFLNNFSDELNIFYICGMNVELL